MLDAAETTMHNKVDVSENEIFRQYPEVLKMLLKDHTTQKPIFWATDSYTAMGDDFRFYAPITPDIITGKNGLVIRPRAVKSKAEQIGRTKGRAEVFTPSWICNAQNNLVDDAWFGRPGAFNVEDEANKRWSATTEPILFPEGKTWKDYVRSTRMEITCGEGPYLASRYDATSGEFIPLQERIGMLDRKLRVVSENTLTTGHWLKMAQEAYKNIYAFEWQGDNLLLTREALLMSFVEYYEAKFGRKPLAKSVLHIAYIISWNVWQMDGLKGVVPDSCRNNYPTISRDLFGDETETIKNCPGCQQGEMRRHNGIYCLVRDWGLRDPETRENNRKIRFVDLIK